MHLLIMWSIVFLYYDCLLFDFEEGSSDPTRLHFGLNEHDQSSTPVEMFASHEHLKGSLNPSTCMELLVLQSIISH